MRDENSLEEQEAALLDRLRQVDGLLSELADEEPPPATVDKVLEWVRAESTHTADPAIADRRHRRRWVWGAAAALAAGLCIALGTWSVALRSERALVAANSETAQLLAERDELRDIAENRDRYEAFQEQLSDPDSERERIREAIQKKLEDKRAEIVAQGHLEGVGPEASRQLVPAGANCCRASSVNNVASVMVAVPAETGAEGMSREAYKPIEDNAWTEVSDQPRSTFSIDVDTASYSNVRRFLRDGQRPPRDAVRIEELLNYFPYSYPRPEIGAKPPFAVRGETGPAPWNPAHRLVSLSIQTQDLHPDSVPARNLVFLLDVSGSMAMYDKLPLLRRAMAMLVRDLRPVDRVAIVVYAGAAGVVLESTSGSDQGRIIEALDRLQAGGSTNGGAGIRRAYDLARAGFVQGGINRVILATDGDFNVGQSSEGELVELIEAQRESGVFLTVLGLGTGNLQDDRMESLANKGNGNYAYLDSIDEARKVLVEQSGGTLVTVAKDVKLQVEWNPVEVQGYRLIGYVNRRLANRDFADDTRDAGEIGAGHSVTALYEVIPAGSFVPGEGDPPLRYQRPNQATAVAGSGEMLSLKIRWKTPQGSQSALQKHTLVDGGVSWEDNSDDFRFSACVAAWGMHLRRTAEVSGFGLAEVRLRARGALGSDPGGHRSEFLELVRLTESLD